MPIPDEPIPVQKARAWTRLEDYWPGRRPARTGRRPRNPLGSASRSGDGAERSRAMLETIPYLVLMIALAILVVAMVVVAWPGRQRPQAPASPPAQAELGTAPKGWIGRPAD